MNHKHTLKLYGVTKMNYVFRCDECGFRMAYDKMCIRNVVLGRVKYDAWRMRRMLW